MGLRTSAEPTAPVAGWWRLAVARLGPAVALFCLLVVLAAGGSAVALLAFPGSTGRYFSWTLRPDAAAAVIGGLYLASAVVFAWALTLPWRQVRPLFVGVVGLTAPTLVLTLVHDQVFDLGRWQAVVWFVLFAGAPVAAVAILATAPHEPSAGRVVPPGVRAVLGGVTVAFAVLGGALWFDGPRAAVGRNGPFDLGGLTGAYLGAWCTFAAAMAGWGALRGRRDDVRLPLVALAAVAAGVGLGLLRTWGELRRPAAAVVGAAVLGGVAVALLAAVRPERAADARDDRRRRAVRG